ncbi:CD48 antigen-like isoform 2-T2 [Theristicus caerulescens]
MQRQDGGGACNGALPPLRHASPRLQSQESYHQIHWRCNNTVKIASRDSKGNVHYPNNAYEGRVELFLNNTLKISSLRKSDSNTYWVYLENDVGKEHIENVLLSVYDLVPKPTVKAKVIRGDSSLCDAKLECSVGLEGVTYEWIRVSKPPLQGPGTSEWHVCFDPYVETYICKVSNPVSSNRATLTYRHPCSWTGESSAAASCTTTSLLVALGHLLLLFFLLTLA